MEEKLEKNYEVYVHNGINLLLVGHQIGHIWGGVVTDPNGHDVAGCVHRDPVANRWYLKADNSWHTAKRWNGATVSVDNRPSKRFN